MSEEKKKQGKQLHVGTLHIHADEIVLHQPESKSSSASQAPQGPTSAAQQGPTGSAQQEPIPRDFWGFPIRQVQPGPGPQEEATEEAKGEEVENKEEIKEENKEEENVEEKKEETEAARNEQENPNVQQGPQGPPFGWI